MDEGRRRRFERVRAVLACPRCHGALAYSAAAARCGACAVDYPIRDHRVYFIDVPQREDEMDRLKGALKRMLGQAYYKIGVHWLAPTFPLNFGQFIARHVDPSSQFVVDAGSGNHRLHADAICIDLFDYEVVDIVCALDALPFRSATIDAFVSRSVLEHVPAPARVVGEFHRCTRTGGLGIHVIPFLFPFHASPADYHRFTHRGHDMLFQGWQPVLRTNPTGPVSAWLLQLIEVLSTVLSLNVARVKSFFYLALCGILFPLKFLDAPFVNRSAFMGSAASILSVVRKTE
jgi:SAM-dependent methyltransferase